MSKNRQEPIYVFNKTEMKAHNRNLAKAVNRASVKRTARKMVRMNPGQQLQVLSKDCEEFLFTDDVLDRFGEAILAEEFK